jgi:hypothetical protein
MVITSVLMVHSIQINYVADLWLNEIIIRNELGVQLQPGSCQPS